MKKPKKYFLTESSNSPRALSRGEALRLVETSYLAATSALIWIALYYFPIGGALFRLSLPLPIALLQLRRGVGAGIEGLSLLVLLLMALMGPVRGPLVLFPYGFLSLWLGWSWSKNFSWWMSWGVGAFIATLGFLVRVFLLSILVGENLWVVITRAGSILIERFIDVFNLPFSSSLTLVQIVALLLVLFQELVFVLTLHAVAFWIFPRLKARLPDPPRLLNSLIAFEPT